MSIGTPAIIQIGSNPYPSYVSVADADFYLAAAFHAQPTWSVQTTTAKAQALITASRILDRQRWLGDEVSATQALQWPRTGFDSLLDPSAGTLIPTKVAYAAIEMALALIQGADFQTAQNQSQKISNLKAGSVSIGYFRLAEGPPIRWPLIIQELLRDYLGSSSQIAATSSSGVEGQSVTDQDFGVTRGM
jgi:hypothetical protein